jgi:hypothetical protein
MEQCLEHLTEDEKKISAQIRSVAASLYEKVDLDRPTVEFLCEHFAYVLKTDAAEHKKT